MPPPPRNKALLRDHFPLVSLNEALLGAYFLGGYGIGGVPLDSHDISMHYGRCQQHELQNTPHIITQKMHGRMIYIYPLVCCLHLPSERVTFTLRVFYPGSEAD